MKRCLLAVALKSKTSSKGNDGAHSAVDDFKALVTSVTGEKADEVDLGGTSDASVNAAYGSEGVESGPQISGRVSFYCELLL